VRPSQNAANRIGIIDMKGERMKTISAALLVLLLAAGAWADDAIPPGHWRRETKVEVVRPPGRIAAAELLVVDEHRHRTRGHHRERQEGGLVRDKAVADEQQRHDGQQDHHRRVALVAEPRGEVSKGFRRVGALVRLLRVISQERDDAGHIERSLEALDASLEECGCAHVTVVHDGRRDARRM